MRCALKYDSPYITVDEAALYLKCDVKTIYLYKKKGRLQTFRRGGVHGDILFLREEVEKLIIPEKAVMKEIPGGYDVTHDIFFIREGADIDAPANLSRKVDEYLYGKISAKMTVNKRRKK